MRCSNLSGPQCNVTGLNGNSFKTSTEYDTLQGQRVFCHQSVCNNYVLPWSVQDLWHTSLLGRKSNSYIQTHTHTLCDTLKHAYTHNVWHIHALTHTHTHSLTQWQTDGNDKLRLLTPTPHTHSWSNWKAHHILNSEHGDTFSLQYILIFFSRTPTALNKKELPRHSQAHKWQNGREHQQACWWWAMSSWNICTHTTNKQKRPMVFVIMSVFSPRERERREKKKKKKCKVNLKGSRGAGYIAQWYSATQKAVRNTKVGSIPQCSKGFFSQAQLKSSTLVVVPLSGRTKILHTLVSMGSAALATAVAVPR